MAVTVLVTGGSGYIAGWCIVQLLKRGDTVRATVRSLSKEQALRQALASAFTPGDDRDHQQRLSLVAADLTADEGWDAAVAGCDAVLHVASPLGVENPRNPDDLIVPARDGALRVLKAAAKAGVKRVVMTSSLAASALPPSDKAVVTDEDLWTDVDGPNLNAYRKSKTIAERAAWQFIKEHDGAMTLSTILPGAVFGPMLSADNLGSVQMISRLMQGRMPGTPRLGLEVVDVRDVADMHIRAMDTPQAGGERFIAVGEFMWLADIAATLRAKLGPAAAKVPTRGIPDIAVRLVSLFDPSIQTILPMIGRRNRHSADKAKQILGWSARPADQTIIDTANKLIELKAV